MKDTRKLSVVYFVISLVMLLMVCFGCENEVEDNQIVETRICRTYEEMDYVVCYDSEWKSYDDMKLEGVSFIEGGLKNFILQSDFGILEYEDGKLIYTADKTDKIDEPDSISSASQCEYGYNGTKVCK